MQRQELRRRLVDAREAELDEGKLVPAREEARDAAAGGEALVEQRLRERAACLGGAASDLREPVGAEQTGGGDQVGDELGAGVDAEALQRRAERRRERLAVGESCRTARGSRARLRTTGGGTARPLGLEDAQMWVFRRVHCRSLD